MSIIDEKFNEWRVLLEKYTQAELNGILWKMGSVIGQADHARLFPKVFLELAQKIASGKVKMPTLPPFDIDALIKECDGIMVDGYVANFIDSDDPERVIIVVDNGVWFDFYKTELTKMPLGTLGS